MKHYINWYNNRGMIWDDHGRSFIIEVEVTKPIGNYLRRITRFLAYPSNGGAVISAPTLDKLITTLEVQ